METEEITSRLTRLEDLITEQQDLIDETNEIVRKMYRASRISFWFKAVMWAAILILPFFLVGPLLKAILPIQPNGQVNMFGYPSTADIQKALETYKETLAP